MTREAITWKQEREFLKFIKKDRHFCKYYDGIYILFNTGLRVSEFCFLIRIICRWLHCIGRSIFSISEKSITAFTKCRCRRLRPMCADTHFVPTWRNLAWTRKHYNILWDILILVSHSIHILIYSLMMSKKKWRKSVMSSGLKVFNLAHNWAQTMEK